MNPQTLILFMPLTIQLDESKPEKYIQFSANNSLEIFLPIINEPIIHVIFNHEMGAQLEHQFLFGEHSVLQQLKTLQHQLNKDLQTLKLLESSFLNQKKQRLLQVNLWIQRINKLYSIPKIQTLSRLIDQKITQHPNFFSLILDSKKVNTEHSTSHNPAFTLSGMNSVFTQSLKKLRFPELLPDASNIFYQKILNHLSQQEEWIIKIELLFGFMNAYARGLNISQNNFGHDLEKPRICRAFINDLSKVIDMRKDISTFIFQWVNYNNNTRSFSLTRLFNKDEEQNIFHHFQQHLSLIVNQTNFDELVVLFPELQGYIDIYQNQVCIKLHEIYPKHPICSKNYEAKNIDQIHIESFQILEKLKSNSILYLPLLFHKTADNQFLFQNLPISIVHFNTSNQTQKLLEMSEQFIATPEEKKLFQNYLDKNNLCFPKLTEQMPFNQLLILVNTLSLLSSSQNSEIYPELKNWFLYLYAIKEQSLEPTLLRKIMVVTLGKINHCHQIIEEQKNNLNSIQVKSLKLYINLVFKLHRESFFQPKTHTTSVLFKSLENSLDNFIQYLKNAPPRMNSLQKSIIDGFQNTLLTLTHPENNQPFCLNLLTKWIDLSILLLNLNMNHSFLKNF